MELTEKTAERCLCLDGSSRYDNAERIQLAHALASLPRTGSALTGIPASPSGPNVQRTHSGSGSAAETSALRDLPPPVSTGMTRRTWCLDRAERIDVGGHIRNSHL